MLAPRMHPGEFVASRILRHAPSLFILESKSAVDWRDSARPTNIFPIFEFSLLQTLSTPTSTPVARAVGFQLILFKPNKIKLSMFGIVYVFVLALLMYILLIFICQDNLLQLASIHFGATLTNSELQPPNLSFFSRFLFNTFGNPHGFLGRFGGLLMAHSNRSVAMWLIDLLHIQSTDTVLEVGFGPGVAIELLTARIKDGHISGVDISTEMVSMANNRNLEAVTSGMVDLRQASVTSLPHEDNQFSKTLTINSFQLWPNANAGLSEINRVMQSGGLIALGFTPLAQPRPGKKAIMDMMSQSGFKKVRVEENGEMACFLGVK